MRMLAALAGAAAVALSLALGGGLAYAAEDEEENVPLDTKLFRQFMKDIGAMRDGPGIEYRERAPLVVPPTRNLPPPQAAGAAAAANPAWPKDPDVLERSKRKQTSAAERAKLKASADQATDDARPLSPSELDRGRTAAARKTGTIAPEADDAQRPMRAEQLSGKKSIFDSMFSAITPGKPEAAEFTGEPPRTSMTAPPPGYQTPSAEHPYGLRQKDQRKTSTVVDRVEPAR
jgi:hypothetical protein